MTPQTKFWKVFLQGFLSKSYLPSEVPQIFGAGLEAAVGAAVCSGRGPDMGPASLYPAPGRWGLRLGSGACKAPWWLLRRVPPWEGAAVFTVKWPKGNRRSPEPPRLGPVPPPQGRGAAFDSGDNLKERHGQDRGQGAFPPRHHSCVCRTTTGRASATMDVVVITQGQGD